MEWPGHWAYGYNEEQYGWGYYEPGYGPRMAGIGINGGYLDGSVSFPDTATGSAATWGTGVVTYTLLPGTTLTFSGDWGASWLLMQPGLSGYYDMTLRTWEAPYQVPETLATLLTRNGSFSSDGYGGFSEGASFSFTNDTDTILERTFALEGYLLVNGNYVPPAVTPGLDQRCPKARDLVRLEVEDRLHGISRVRIPASTAGRA